MLAKRTHKNQITIPKAVIQHFKNVTYFDIREEGGEIVLKPIRLYETDNTLEEIRNKMKKLKISEADISEAVRAARKPRS